MSNPYESPVPPTRIQDSCPEVRRSAIALIIVSLVAIIFGSVGLVVDIGLIVSGAVDRLEEMNQSPISKHTQMTVRVLWGVVLVLASSFVLYGAIQMKNLKNYGTARAAAFVSVIPLLGPCCVLGIPFGIWALVTLGRPGVKDQFETNSQ